MSTALDTSWLVYILQCSDGSLYTGITNNMERRLKEHNSKSSKTKYTRTRQPVSLLKTITCQNRSTALRLEHRLKQMSRQQKISYLALVVK